MTDFEKIAIEDTKKWLLEAVVGLNLCPFAKAVVVKDMVRYRVCASAEPADVLALLREELQHLAEADPDKLDTTLLIAPNFLFEFFSFFFKSFFRKNIFFAFDFLLLRF